MTPRTLTTAQAATYLGCKSVRQFRREVSAGIWPAPIAKASRPQRWSTAQLDKVLEADRNSASITEKAVADLDSRFGL